MTAPTIDKLRAYLPFKGNTSDGQSVPSYALTGSSTAAILYPSGLATAAGYWDGAIGWFTGTTTTVALRGVFFHVAASTTSYLILAVNLPAAPTAGDTIKLAIGGNYRTSQECLGLLLDDTQPQIVTVTGTNITGLTVTFASPTLGIGTLEIAWDATGKTLAARMNSGSYGTPVDASSNLTDEPIFIDADVGFVRVTTVALSLPVGNQTDAWTLTTPKASFTPNIDGYETVGGKIRYRLEVVKNTDPVTDMVDVQVYSDKPSGSNTEIATGSSLGLEAGDFVVDSALGWPTVGFWVLNSTKSDCRYIRSRSGTTLTADAVEWLYIEFTSGLLDRMAKGNLIRPGDDVPRARIFDYILTGSVGMYYSGYLLACQATTGWVGAVGVKAEVTPGQWLGAFNCSSCAYSLRGFLSVAWEEGDVIELMSDVDLRLQVPTFPSTGPFVSPTSERFAPGSFDFAHAAAIGDALSLGTLRPGGVAGIWRREWIVDDNVARDGISTDTLYSWS